MAGGAYPTNKVDMDYRAEDDHRTLMRAAEIMADKIRMKGVMAQMKKKDDAEACLDQMLASYKKTGKLSM